MVVAEQEEGGRAKSVLRGVVTGMVGGRHQGEEDARSTRHKGGQPSGEQAVEWGKVVVGQAAGIKVWGEARDRRISANFYFCQGGLR